MVWCLKIYKVHVAALSKFLIIKIKQCTTFDAGFFFSFQQIPSIASLLFLLKDFLCIQDLSVTELELSFIYASKSSLLARIFTALLITPHQRKRWNISIIFMHVFYNLLSIGIFLVCVSFMLVQFSVRLKIFDFLVAFNLSNI